MKPQTFHGIYPSTVLPMRGDYSVDWESYARHTAHCVLRDGMAGVLINGHAGENYVMTRAEKKRAVEVSVATVGASRLVVAGVNAESSLEAAEEAREAKAARPPPTPSLGPPAPPCHASCSGGGRCASGSAAQSSACSTSHSVIAQVLPGTSSR